MNISIIGATGSIGQRILAEALSRGHQVTALARELSRIPEGKKTVTWKRINVLDSDTHFFRRFRRRADRRSGTAASRSKALHGRILI